MPLTSTTIAESFLYLTSVAIAQNLTFVRPRLSAFQTNDEGTPQLTGGENLTIEWESEFQYTTLLVYQEIATEVFEQDVLARMYYSIHVRAPFPGDPGLTLPYRRCSP